MVEISRIVAAGSTLGPAERIDIYAQMYFWRQVDALREDFPALAALLGEEHFPELVAAYLKVHPSEHPSLGRLGDRLAGFLREHVAEGARADLADVASLEWARSEVFVELDAVPLPRSAFSNLAPDAFAQSRLRLIPGMRLLSLQHDALGPWHAVEHAGPPPEPSARKQHLLVWRKHWSVFHVEVASDEAQALRWAREGRPVAEFCEAFAERESPAEAAFKALQSWLSEELVAGIEVP